MCSTAQIGLKFLLIAFKNIFNKKWFYFISLTLKIPLKWIVIIFINKKSDTQLKFGSDKQQLLSLKNY